MESVFPLSADEVDSRRIGVFFRSTGERERKRHACVMRAVEAMRDALIIRLKAEQTGDECAIRAVSVSRGGK